MLRARNLSKFQLWEYSVHGSSLSGIWLADGQVENVQDDLFICLETTLFTGGWAQLRLQTSHFKVVRLDVAAQSSQRMCPKRSRGKLQGLLRPNLGNTRVTSATFYWSSKLLWSAHIQGKGN